MKTNNIKVFVITSSHKDYPEQLSVHSLKVFKAFTPNWDPDVHIPLEIQAIAMNQIKSGELDPEYYAFKQALEQCSESTFTIFVKDTATTCAQAHSVVETIEEIIEKSSQKQHTFDICYLGKWMDRCDQYEKSWDLTERGLSVYDTFSPHGTLAILFSPSGAKKFMDLPPLKKDTIPLGMVLNHQISHRNQKSEKHFIAITTYPSLFVFDVQRATTQFDYYKLTECANVSDSIRPEKKNGNSTLVIFIVIALIVAGWYLYNKYILNL